MLKAGGKKKVPQTGDTQCRQKTKQPCPLARASCRSSETYKSINSPPHSNHHKVPHLALVSSWLPKRSSGLTDGESFPRVTKGKEQDWNSEASHICLYPQTTSREECSRKLKHSGEGTENGVKGRLFTFCIASGIFKDICMDPIFKFKMSSL
jgi:hypothetical protein